MSHRLTALRGERAGTEMLRRRLAERIRSQRLPLDPAAADEVRRSGFTRT